MCLCLHCVSVNACVCNCVGIGVCVCICACAFACACLCSNTKSPGVSVCVSVCACVSVSMPAAIPTQMMLAPLWHPCQCSSKRPRGGWRQRLVEGEDDDEQPVSISRLAGRWLRQWPDGSLSSTELQAMCHDATVDGLHHPMVMRTAETLGAFL